MDVDLALQHGAQVSPWASLAMQASSTVER
jgi:hypothetical protein